MQRPSFNFIGKIPASKSILNRLLIVKSLHPGLSIGGESAAEDVLTMKAALHQLASSAPNSPTPTTLHCGQAGTVLRFLAPRLCHGVGHFRLIGHASLFARPMEELLKTLRQLGAIARVADNTLILETFGFRPQGDGLYVSMERSSQFASGLLLSCWGLPREVLISLSRTRVSDGYLALTISLLRDLGMRIDFVEDSFLRIPPQQKLAVESFSAEPDMSSAFAIAAAGALFGQTVLLDMSMDSRQPDIVFADILKKMHVPVTYHDRTLKISQAREFHPIDLDLTTCPDLFPVLAVLCAQAKGVSYLRGASHLEYKESPRLTGILRLLEKIGVRAKQIARGDNGGINSGIEIVGGLPPLDKISAFEFDPMEDHRMLMAAALLQKIGVPVTLLRPSCVNKSFPEFLDILGVNAPVSESNS